jgi:hypothetical protein
MLPAESLIAFAPATSIRDRVAHGAGVACGRVASRCGTLRAEPICMPKDITGNAMSGDDAGEGPTPDKKGDEPPEKVCQRCSSPTLQSNIGKFGDQPAYKIYRCSACGYAEWVEVR